MTTIAASLSVAFENARLFDETKRLLTETDERAAELAIINEVQRGLAERLDMQAMYEVVGDKIQEIFDAQVVDIGDLRPRGAGHPLPLHHRARRALSGRALAFIDAAASSWRLRGPLVINDIPAWQEERGQAIPVIQGEPPVAICACP